MNTVTDLMTSSRRRRPVRVQLRALMVPLGLVLTGCSGDTTEHDFRFFGNVPGGRVGTTLAVADVNGDSYDDMVVGAPNLQGVFVVFGGKPLP